jgi:Ca2+-binding EF-hand superfamily protein
MSFLPITKALDANGDGEISAKELENAAVALKKLDKNNDGKLTEDEIRPNRPGGDRGGPPGQGGERGAQRGERGGPPGQDGDRGSRGGPPSQSGERGGRGGSGSNAAEMVSRLLEFDENKDGKLSKNEVSERMQTIIQRADTNKDGFADKAELTKMAESRMGGGGGRGGERGRGEGGGGGTTRPSRPEFDN